MLCFSAICMSLPIFYIHPLYIYFSIQLPPFFSTSLSPFFFSPFHPYSSSSLSSNSPSPLTFPLLSPPPYTSTATLSPLQFLLSRLLVARAGGRCATAVNAVNVAKAVAAINAVFILLLMTSPLVGLQLQNVFFPLTHIWCSLLSMFTLLMMFARSAPAAQ